MYMDLIPGYINRRLGDKHSGTNRILGDKRSNMNLRLGDKRSEIISSCLKRKEVHGMQRE